MPKTAAELVQEARARIALTSPDDAAAADDVLFVDVRERHEREDGFIPGSVSAPRGTLEFLADETNAYHDAAFDKDRRTIVYCVSGHRSSLATATLMDLGFSDVSLLDGGITAWKDAGHPTAS